MTHVERYAELLEAKTTAGAGADLFAGLLASIDLLRAQIALLDLSPGTGVSPEVGEHLKAAADILRGYHNKATLRRALNAAPSYVYLSGVGTP